MQKFKMYIGGKFVDGDDEFESINPASGRAWAIMPAASKKQTCRAVECAHRVFNSPSWKSLTATARGKMLFSLAQLVEDNSDELAMLETLDSGKIIRETTSQIAYIADYFRYYAGLADKVQGAHLPIDKQDMEVWLRREPIGVVAAVVPWNSQLFLTAVKLCPALAAGCTVVLKVSEFASAPLLHFAKLIDQLNLPPGAVNIINGFAKPCGETLTSHPLISRIAFTGGAKAARAVVQNSANNFAHTTLELGGKSPIIVFADADLEDAANAVVAGVFAAGGQSCVSGSRLIAHHSIKEKLLKKLVQKARAVKIGSPQKMQTEMGPLATKRQLQNISLTVRQTIKAGAVLCCGGGGVKGLDDELKNGYYYQPTILDCDNAKNPGSWKKELFGPVLSLKSFDDEKTAVEMANDSDYGLAGGVFTQNLSLAHRTAKNLRAGICWINTYRAISPMSPFGGFGLSGFGRESGFESLLDYTRTKAVWVNTSDSPLPDPFVMR